MVGAEGKGIFRKTEQARQIIYDGFTDNAVPAQFIVRIDGHEEPTKQREAETV